MLSSQPKLKPAQEIQFIDLQAQQQLIRNPIDTAISKVLDHGQYIMGPEVIDLEQNLSKFCNAQHTLSCSNGTDALMLALMAKNIQPNDVVFVPAFTFVATAEVVALLGAIPFFVDVNPDTFNMCPNSLADSITKARKTNMPIKGIITVDLFGLPADYDAINPVAQANDLWIIADAAQSFGATYKNRPVGTLAELTCTSFFPAKPLGCYGDGGAIFTNNEQLLQIMQSCRVHGQGAHKYENVRIGMTGRLDTIQAAILLEKLKIFANEIESRQKIAAQYNAALKDVVTTPVITDTSTSVWAQYTIQTDKRDEMQQKLQQSGIPTMVYYPIALPDQKAYLDYPRINTDVAHGLCKNVISLPMNPYLYTESVQYICEQVAR